MNNELDLATLEELLETLEPETIRARYADRLSPQGHALLTAYESLPGDLSELKRQVPPPAVPERKAKPIFRWSQWVTPLAALLVLGIALAGLFLPDVPQRRAREAGSAATGEAMAPKKALARDSAAPQPASPEIAPAEPEPDLQRQDGPMLGGLRDKQDSDLRTEKPGQVAPAPLKKEKRRVAADRVAEVRQQPVEEAKDRIHSPQPAASDDQAEVVGLSEGFFDKAAEAPVADGERVALAEQDGFGVSPERKAAAPPVEEAMVNRRPGTVRFDSAKRETPELGEDESAGAVLDERVVASDAGEALILSWLYQFETVWEPGTAAPAGLFTAGAKPRWPAGLAPEGSGKPPIHLHFLRKGSRARQFVLGWTGVGASGEMNIVLDSQGRCEELRPLP